MRRLVFASVVLVAVLGAEPAAAATNPQVPGLQVALKARGLYSGAVDGIAGPLTAQAVRKFQRSAGLQVDGLAGPRTRRALGRLGRPLFGSRTLAQGAIGWDVSVLQFLLARRGLAPPHLNGNFGKGTQRAVIRFQRRRGLAQDGIVGTATRAALLGQRVPAAKPRAPRVRYTVRPGDTLAGIADRYGSTISVLARANQLRSANLIVIGMRLVIPNPAPRALGTDAVAVRALIDRWAAHYGVNRSLARALAWMESGFQPAVVSSVGAWGVMQVTPETWDFVTSVLIGTPIARTTDGNVRVGIAYLRHLLREFEGDERLALAGYYQGPWAVRKRGVLPESERFVANVLALKSRF